MENGLAKTWQITVLEDAMERQKLVDFALLHFSINAANAIMSYFILFMRLKFAIVVKHLIQRMASAQV